MASQIQLTRSGTSGVQPEPSELEYGELAINYADGKLFYKDSAISVKAINDTYLNSNNTIYVNSTNSAEPKIGLNTTSPEHLLDLGGDTGSTYNSLRINQGATGTAIRIGTAASGDVTLMRVDSTNGETDSQGYGFSIDYLGVGGGNNKKLAIMADNQDGTAVQALTILQDGKIGIGTDTPSHELEVDGTIRVTGNTNLIRFNDGTEDIGFINNNFKKLQINAGGSVDTLQLQTNGNNALVIDNAQKVGIGTTAPYSKLTVKGVEGVDTASFTLENSGGARVHQYYNGSASADDFYITRSGTGGSEITLQSAGDLILNGVNGNNVGIGTTTPSVKLEVDGDVTATGNAIAATPTADTHLTTKAYVDDIAIRNIAFNNMAERGARGMTEGRLLGYTQNNMPTDSNSFTFSIGAAAATAYYETANSVLSSSGVLAQGIVTRRANSNFMITTAMNVGLLSADHQVAFRVEYSVNDKSSWQAFNLPALDDNIYQRQSIQHGAAVGHAGVASADLNEDVHTVNINQFLENPTYTAGDTIHFRVMMMAYYLTAYNRTIYINRPESLRSGATAYHSSTMQIEEIYTQ